jgi:hypothetical protein
MKVSASPVMPLARLAVVLLPTVTAVRMASTSPITSVRAVMTIARPVKVNQPIALAVIQLSTI